MRDPKSSRRAMPTSLFECLERRMLLAAAPLDAGSDGDAMTAGPALAVAPDHSQSRATSYQTRVIASGLLSPVGIVAGTGHALYFTQVPNPGVPNAGNSVEVLNVRSGEQRTLHMGEPEPTNITIDRRGNLYWTCKSAGVILCRTRDGQTIPLLTGLDQPSGIAVDHKGENLYFTEVPTPGVPGSMGGLNTVNRLNLVTGERTVLDSGDPEPVDVAVSRKGDLYWTCKSAGVIVRRTPDGTTNVILQDLDSPVGIAINHRGDALYFTEVPTPGVPGSMGGQNQVSVMDLRSGGVSLIDRGDPEPTDVTVARNGTVYWTCTSAGVIVEATRARHGATLAGRTPSDGRAPGASIAAAGVFQALPSPTALVQLVDLAGDPA